MKCIQLLHHVHNKKLLVYHYLFSFSYELKCEQGTGEPTLTKQTTNKTLEEVDIRAIGQRKQCSWPFPWRELPTSPETEMNFSLAFSVSFFYHNLVRSQLIYKLKCLEESQSQKKSMNYLDEDCPSLENKGPTWSNNHKKTLSHNHMRM